MRPAEKELHGERPSAPAPIVGKYKSPGRIPMFIFVSLLGILLLLYSLGDPFGFLLLLDAKMLFLPQR